MKKLLLILCLGFIACGHENDDEGGIYNNWEDMPIKVCPSPAVYFKADGSPYTDCYYLDLCQDPPAVFDANGKPYACSHNGGK